LWSIIAQYSGHSGVDHPTMADPEQQRAGQPIEIVPIVTVLDASAGDRRGLSDLANRAIARIADLAAHAYLADIRGLTLPTFHRMFGAILFVCRKVANTKRIPKKYKADIARLECKALLPMAGVLPTVALHRAIDVACAGVYDHLLKGVDWAVRGKRSLALPAELTAESAPDALDALGKKAVTEFAIIDQCAQKAYLEEGRNALADPSALFVAALYVVRSVCTSKHFPSHYELSIATILLTNLMRRTLADPARDLAAARDVAHSLCAAAIEHLTAPTVPASAWKLR
jgi:hypothetical protein